jgi:hypothetical protein
VTPYSEDVYIRRVTSQLSTKYHLHAWDMYHQEPRIKQLITRKQYYLARKWIKGSYKSSQDPTDAAKRAIKAGIETKVVAVLAGDQRWHGRVMGFISRML